MNFILEYSKVGSLTHDDADVLGKCLGKADACFSFAARHVAGSFSESPCVEGSVGVLATGEVVDCLHPAYRFQHALSVSDILHGYLQFGDVFVEQLCGHFGIVIWDTETATVKAWVDPCGLRNLFYVINNSSVLISNCIEVLLRHPTVSNNLNRCFIFGYLLLGPLSSYQTPYAAVNRLEYGCKLLCSLNGVTTSSYWKTQEWTPIVLDRVTEYSDLLRDLLHQVVQGYTLAEPAASAVLLSGGVDSSSVAAISHAIASQMGKGMIAFSIGFRIPRHGDEADYRDAVTRGLEMDNYIVWSDAGCSWLDRPYEQPYAPFWSGTYAKLFESAANCGISAILSGFGGDEMFTGFRDAAALDGYTRVAMSKLGGIPRVDIPRWAKIDLASARAAVEEFTCTPFFNRDGNIQLSLEAVHSEWTRCGYQLLQVLGRDYNVSLRAPLLDRRIIEWAARIPPALKLRKGVTKYILRRAMRGLVPCVVLRRRDKACADHFIRDVVANSLGKLRRWLKTNDARELFNGDALLDDIKGWLSGDKSLSVSLESALSLLHWMMCKNYPGGPNRY